MVKKRSIEFGGKSLDFVCVPAGEFLAGSTAEQIQKVYDRTKEHGIQIEWLQKEFPQHQQYVEEFWIACTPFTVEIHDICLNNGRSMSSDGHGDFPAVVNRFEDAVDFLIQASDVGGVKLRLPTEFEWEKAARGCSGQLYPWGEEFSESFCNTLESGIGSLVQVGEYAAGRSPYGCVQMAGNIEEWTSSWYTVYPGGTEIADIFGGEGDYRIIKGGKYSSHLDLAHCARRHGVSPRSVIGIRPVIELP